MQVSAAITLSQAGFAPSASDRDIWLYCQSRRLLLLTANRNRRGEDSLQEVLEELNQESSLPVLTLANPQRALFDSVYRELCAYRICDIALDLASYLGAARLFVP